MDQPVSSRREAEVREAFERLSGLGPKLRRAGLAELRRRDPELARSVERRFAAEEPRGEGGLDALEGSRVGHYRIESRIGEGGMGVVYRARDERLNRTVALKFLPGHLSRDPSLNRRFLNEAKCASALEHENICAVHELDWTEDGRAFLVMPCYEGESLSVRLQRGPLAVPEALRVALQMASGLSAAHGAGIIHRDVKPSNVFVKRSGTVKLLDFGLAKAVDVDLTRTGSPLGTVAYMSPEQMRGEPLDVRTDIWSLGVVLYEMLTGRRAFERDTPVATMAAVLQGEPEPLAAVRPEVPEAVCRLVETCLRKSREDRFATMQEVMEAVREVLRGPEGVASGGAHRKGGGAPRGKAWGRTARASVLVVSVGLLGIAIWWGLGRYAGGAGAPKEHSIAVLPFRGYGPGDETGRLADELSEGLTVELRKMERLRVVPYRSVMVHREGSASIAELAGLLGVGFVVDGSVRGGDSGAVRIAVGLFEGRTQVSLWSDQIETSRLSLMAAEQRIAASIAEVLGPLIADSLAPPARGAHRPHPIARQLFLRATLLRTEEETVGYGDKLDRAMELYRAAARIDPLYAEPLAEMSLMFLWKAWMHRGPWSQAIDSSAHFVNRAYALDSTSAVVLTQLGIVRQFAGFDWQGAARALRRAIHFSPESSEARVEYAYCLVRMCHYEEAVLQARAAVESDPYSIHALAALSSVCLGGGRFEEAIAVAERAQRIDPGWSKTGAVNVARAYAGLGRFERAGQVLEEAGYLDRGVPDWVQGNTSAYVYYVLARAGYREEIREKAAEAGAMWRSNRDLFSESYYVAALAYHGLGETDEALSWLERGFAVLPIPLLSWDPEWEGLRDHPRFKALMAQMNLPVEGAD